MSGGLVAVKDGIAAEFNSPKLDEHHDVDKMAAVIYFDAEGRHFTVRVSDEFNQDYGTGTVTHDPERLAAILRQSKDGKATVKRSGIF